MPSFDSQRAAHRFFSERLQTLEPFTKEQLREATGWSQSALNTYWSKQFKGLLEPVDDKVRFPFKELFIYSITQLVRGEDEIWVVESGMRHRVHIWRPGDN